MDLLMAAVSFNVFKNNKNCQPYFSNWIACSNMLSILSVINIPIEYKLTKERSMKLGRNIVEKDYLDQDKLFRGVLRRVERN